MKNQGKRWTHREDALLICEYQGDEHEDQWLCSRLGRSYSAIRNRAHKLGLSRDQRREVSAGVRWDICPTCDGRLPLRRRVRIQQSATAVDAICYPCHRRALDGDRQIRALIGWTAETYRTNS